MNSKQILTQSIKEQIDKKENIVKEMTVMNLIMSSQHVTLYNSILGFQNNSVFQKDLSSKEVYPLGSKKCFRKS
jgi:hypothetical protein